MECTNGWCDVNKCVVHLTVLENDSGKSCNNNYESDSKSKKCTNGHKSVLKIEKNNIMVLIPSIDTRRREILEFGTFDLDNAYMPLIDSCTSHVTYQTEEIGDWNPTFSNRPRKKDDITPTDTYASRSISICHSAMLSMPWPLDRRYIGHFLNTLRRSMKFSTHFLSFAKSSFIRYLCPQVFEDVTYKLSYLICVHTMSCEKEYLDYLGSGLIHTLVKKKMLLDDAMNWLNTLGGGYSALGDYFSHHSIEAAKISVRQLKVALEMGDPPTVIRCYLYFGLSLMQRGYLREAKHIIRHQYKEAGRVAATDHRLTAMCKGLWSRLGYYYQLRKTHRDKTLIKVSELQNGLWH